MSMTLTHPETIGSLPPPVAAKAEKKPRLRLDFLDGLRALALIWVVLGHFVLVCVGWTEQHGLLGLATNWLHYLHFGVDIFIVLSGFCLIIPVARSGSLSGGPFTFFKKRARRILPPLYIAMILCTGVDTVAAHLSNQWFYVGKKIFLANVLLLQDLYSGQNIINGAFWSVALEWRIYFLFPLFVYILHRYGRKAALGAAAGISSGIAGGMYLYNTIHHLSTIWNTCPWYVLLFTLGACAGSVVFDTARPVAWKHFSKGMLAVSLAASLSLAVTLWLYPVISFDSYVRHVRSWPVVDPLMGILTASLLLWLGRGVGSLRGLCLRLLSWRPLVALGGFSYSVYLLHLPMVALVETCLWPKVHWSGSVKLLALTCIGGPIILGLSYLFYLVCERPFMNTRPTESKIAALPGSLRFAPAPPSPSPQVEEIEARAALIPFE